ncbi:MAG: sugar phosphate isomerase/epimerase family protein [Planctomycetota bacterium]
MRITYSISQWNFFHYANQPSLERVIASVREQGYGFELWGSWADERDLYDEVGRRRLAGPLAGMAVSLHTGFGYAENFERYKNMIDTAAHLKAKAVVLHPGDLSAGETNGPDAELVKRAAEYGRLRGVTLTLENGSFEFLAAAFGMSDSLGFCLDVGHVYFEKHTMREYLDAFKSRLVHLHVQEVLPADEATIPRVFSDHYIPGTGGIPIEDWKLLVETLKEIDYHGIAVFEIQPRNPLQTAFLGTRFMENLLQD